MGASRAIPPDEVDEWPECPCTRPEHTTAVAAVEPTIPDLDFPTPCWNYSTEKADEGVVSAKRLVNTLPSGWAPTKAAQRSADGVYEHQRPSEAPATHRK